MPLEVRQIGIRLNVGDSGSDGGDGREAAASGPREIDASERAAIVEECVGAVLTALRMQSER